MQEKKTKIILICNHFWPKNHFQLQHAHDAIQMKVLPGVDYRILEKGFEIWTAQGGRSAGKRFKLRSSNILRPSKRAMSHFFKVREFQRTPKSPRSAPAQGIIS